MTRTWTMLPKTRMRSRRVVCACAQWLGDLLAIAAIAWAAERTASAQVSEPPLPGSAHASGPSQGAPTAAGATQCFPSCRDGYVCHQGQCISACNPPCPNGQTCVAGQRCEASFASSSYAREPPLPPPPSRGFADKSFVMLGFHYGFPGTVEAPGGTENPLASTLGFNLRGDVPIEKYLLLGPLFQFGAWRPDLTGIDVDRSYYVDLDLYIRGRIPITTSSTNFQVWAGVPIGLTFDMLGGNVAPTASTAALGWNFGVMGGFAVHFTPKIGLYAETGWMQHKFTHDASEKAFVVRLSQWVLNVGFVFPQ